jgi:TolB-like protein/Tfp pilus assembly protein PilF
MHIFRELQRRNVFRAGLAYLAGSWLIIQIVETLFPIFDLPAALMRITVIMLAVGFVPALIIAWVFEVTPGGLIRDSERPAESAFTQRAAKSFDRIILVILALALALFAIDKFVLAPQREAALVEEAARTGAKQALEEQRLKASAIPAESVAVLPFVNMSGDADNEYFSDGLTETLLHMLAQLPDLKVPARTSAFSFKNRNVDVRSIALALGVAHVLEGSVQKSGDRVRVTAQLIRADDGFHLWSQNYDRTLDDIFAIQDEISTDVAAALGSSLLTAAYSGIKNVDTNDFGAYDLFLKALEQQHINTNDALSRAETLFREAIERDPDFSDAKLGLARNHLWKQWKGIGAGGEYLQVRSLAGDVLARDPENLPAQAMDVWVQLYIAYDERKDNWGLDEKFEPMVDDMLALVRKGNVGSFLVRDVVEAISGPPRNRDEEALEILRAALRLDPLNFELLWAEASLYRSTNRLEDARQSLLTALQIAPDNPLLYATLSEIAADLNEQVEGMDWLRQASIVDPSDPIYRLAIARRFYSFGLKEQGDIWLERARAIDETRAAIADAELMSIALTGDDERLLGRVREILPRTLDRDTRHDIFWPINYYVAVMANQGRARDALDYLGNLVPGLEDYSALAGDNRGTFYAQGVSCWLQQYLMDRDSYRLLMEKYIDTLDTAGIAWREPATNVVSMAVSMGDLDEAKRLFLQHHDSWHWANWWQLLTFPWMEDFRAEPEVAPIFRQRREERERIAEELKNMSMRPEWNL